MSSDRQVRVTVLGDSASGQRALNTLAETGDATATRLGGIGDKIGSALSPAKLAAGAGMLTGVLGSSIAEIGDRLEKSEKQLEAAATAAGIPLEQLDQITKSADKSMENFGHTNTETNGALQKLVQAGRPAEEMQKDLALAANIAAAKHISLADASTLVAKVWSGGGSKELKQWGIDLKAVGGPGGAIDELTKKSTGQASAAMDTFGGHIEVAKVKLEDFVTKGAAKVGPALVSLGPLVGGFGGIISSGLLPALASGVGAAVSFGANMIGAGLSAAAAAIPVMIAWAPVIIGVAAIGLAAFELYKHWDQVWGFIKDIASTAFDWIKSHMELIALVVLAPIAPLVLLWQHWDEVWGLIKGIASAAWNWLRDTISTGVDDVVGFVAGLPGRAVGALSRLGGDIAGVASGAMSSMWNAVSDGASDVVGFVEGIPGRIVGALGSLGSTLWGAGGDLMQGLLNGIEGGAGRVWDALSSFASKALHAVTHPWEAFSPSRAMMRLGGNITDGLAIGIQLGGPRVVSAADTLTAGVRGSLGGVQALRPSFGVGGGLVGLVGGGSTSPGAGDVHITIQAGTVVGANGAQDLARMVRDELVRYGRRVPSLGLSG